LSAAIACSFGTGCCVAISAHLTRPEVPIESFYNEDTGLPE